MKNDLISIIVPVYKVEKYLDKCINSLVSQTYKNLEIILVDDGSPDNCPQICDEWAKKDNRVKVIHKENGGQGSARNSALDILSGNYICFVDSDDWVDENYIELLYSSMVEFNADISICGLKEIFENTKKVKIHTVVSDTKFIDANNLFQNAYTNQNTYCLGPCNKLYKSFIFKDLRFPKIRMYEDSAIYLNIFQKAQKIVLIPNAPYNYLIRKSSTMHNELTPSRSESMFAQNDVRLKFLKDNNYIDLIPYEVTRCLHNCYGQYISTKDKDLKKTIKSKYLNYLSTYKNYISFKNAPLKLKIKMIYLKIF